VLRKKAVLEKDYNEQLDLAPSKIVFFLGRETQNFNY
jgi:hypothetical protein